MPQGKVQSRQGVVPKENLQKNEDCGIGVSARAYE